MRAARDRPAGLQRQQQIQRAFAVGPLRDELGGLDRNVERLRERLERLHAPKRTGSTPAGRAPPLGAALRVRLPPAVRASSAGGARRAPSTPPPVLRFRVADEMDAHRHLDSGNSGSSRWREYIEEFPRLCDREDTDVVDLVRRSEISRDPCHDPVANGLRPSSAVDVPRGRELALEPAAQPRLLLHLAEGGRFLALAVLALPLRERPVVVGRTVDQQYLRGAPVAVAHDDAARRSDGLRHIQARSFGSASSSQAGGPASAQLPGRRPLGRRERFGGHADASPF